MDSNVFKIIQNKDKKPSCRINVEFDEGNSFEFDITILQNQQAWAVKVDEKIIFSLAEKFELTPKVYYDKIKDYFCETPQNVELLFRNDEFAINLLENDMKITFFKCKLDTINFALCVDNLMEKFYTSRKTLWNDLRICTSERDEYERSNKNLKSKLNEFIERKKTEEDELYSSFVLTLNEKKRKIQHLTELLDAFKKGRSTINPIVKERRTKKTKKSEITKQEVSESDSDKIFDYNTDDEYKNDNKEQFSPKKSLDDVNINKKCKISNEPVPSTSRTCFNSIFDDFMPKHNLPKRFKENPTLLCNNVDEPSTSRICNDTCGESMVATTPPRTDNNSPDINFDTQDLLNSI